MTTQFYQIIGERPGGLAEEKERGVRYHVLSTKRRGYMATYSHSRLSTFEQCRLRYKFAYIDRIRVPGEGVEAFLGSVVHDVLERLYTDVRHAKVPPIDEVIDLYHSLWDDRWSDEVRIVKRDYTPRNYRDMGEKYLRGYYDRHHPFEEGVILGLETQDMLDLGDGNRFHIRIDRLVNEGGGVFSVNDYKTGSSLPRQEQLDTDRQLSMYALWVREHFPEAVKVRLVWHYLAFEREMAAEPGPEDLHNVRDQVIGRIGEMERCSSFEPTVTTLCRWCNYQEICPAMSHEARTRDLPPEEFLEEDGVRLVNRLKELSDREKELSREVVKVRQEIIEYARQFDLGAVVGSTARVTIVETDEPMVPRKGTPEREELERRLRERGLYDDVLSLDANAVKRLDDATLEELGLEREVKRQVRLGRK